MSMSLSQAGEIDRNNQMAHEQAVEDLNHFFNRYTVFLDDDHYYTGDYISEILCNLANDNKYDLIHHILDVIRSASKTPIKQTTIDQMEFNFINQDYMVIDQELDTLDDIFDKELTIFDLDQLFSRVFDLNDYQSTEDFVEFEQNINTPEFIEFEKKVN